jgi:hypothetical protein
MVTRAKLIGVVVLVGVPVAAAALWLYGGREVLTKSGKAVSVTVTDELFGGTNTEPQFVRGPVCGYYVGLDAVVAVTAAAVAAAIIWWLVARRRRRSALQTEGGSHDP